jgi:dUTP pyrophosphatase
MSLFGSNKKKVSTPRANILWHKFDKSATIPTKRKSDAGYDVYTIEDNIGIMPHETKLLRTGLGVVTPEGYWFLCKDRGSTGSIGMHLHCGVVDAGYRGELFISLCNTTDKILYISSDVDKVEVTQNTIRYPKSKALMQMILVKLPDVSSTEIDDKEWEKYTNTERGMGKLGSSKK